MTLLDDIIDGATDDAVSTSNLLRKVQIVAHRLGANEITEWVKRELNGYPTSDNLPPYRLSIDTPVLGTWVGYGGSKATIALGPGIIPQEAADALFHSNLLQSIAELEQLASLEDDPGKQWDPTHVVMYQRWVEEGKAPGMAMMNLVTARKVLSKGSIVGMINAARNTALDFALQLQSTDREAGALDGPTMNDPAVAQIIYNMTNNITGHGTNVAAGDHIRQRSEVRAGDLQSLMNAARKLGLSDEGADKLAAAVTGSADTRPTAIQSFLAKVEDGAFRIGTGAAGGVLAGQLSPLIASFLG